MVVRCDECYCKNRDSDGFCNKKMIDIDFMRRCIDYEEEEDEAD